jgi:methyltransferase (TIGR00027 family)
MASPVWRRAALLEQRRWVWEPSSPQTTDTSNEDNTTSSVPKSEEGEGEEQVGNSREELVTRDIAAALSAVSPVWPRSARVWVATRAIWAENSKRGVRWAAWEIVGEAVKNGRYGLGENSEISPQGVVDALVAPGFEETHSFSSALRRAAATVHEEPGFSLRWAERLFAQSPIITKISIAVSGLLSPVRLVVEFSAGAVSRLLSGATTSSAIAAAEANTSVTTKKGSSTAVWTCSSRYYAHGLGFGPDYFARVFFERGGRADALTPLIPVPISTMQARFAELGDVGSSTNTTLGGRESTIRLQAARPHGNNDLITYLQGRTCFIDDEITRFVEEHGSSGGHVNIVMLGAGYDMRAFRHPDLGSDRRDKVHVFEVDAPGTQGHKLALLEDVSFPDLQEELSESAGRRPHYISCDFTTQSWVDRLRENGLDSAAPTLIIWEGVVHYVSERVVEATLRALTDEFSGPASVVFDYPSPAMVEEAGAIMAEIGEPLLFSRDPPDMELFVERCGLTVVEHISLQDGLERYLPIRAVDGESVGVAAPRKCFLAATKVVG